MIFLNDASRRLKEPSGSVFILAMSDWCDVSRAGFVVVAILRIVVKRRVLVDVFVKRRLWIDVCDDVRKQLNVPGFIALSALEWRKRWYVILVVGVTMFNVGV
jgi:hypothetical protein